MAFKVKLKNVRLSFPDLFEARQFEGKGPFRFGASFLIEPGSDNDKAVEAAILAAAAETWTKPERAKAVLESIRGNKQQYCYTKGDTKDFEGYAGMLVLSAKRKQEAGRPVVLGADLSPLTAADGKPYAGCYVDATVELWGQEGKHQGMRCGLLGVQFRRDGDAFSGAGKGKVEDFDDLSEGADADALV